jgi:hypothetical protein
MPDRASTCAAMPVLDPHQALAYALRQVFDLAVE